MMEPLFLVLLAASPVFADESESEHEEEAGDLLADPDFVFPKETDDKSHVSLRGEENNEVQVSGNEQEVYIGLSRPYSQSRVRLGNIMRTAPVPTRTDVSNEVINHCKSFYGNQIVKWRGFLVDKGKTYKPMSSIDGTTTQRMNPGKCSTSSEEDMDLVQYRDYRVKARISEGVPATIDEFPFIAFVSYNTGNNRSINCAGTIITQDWALTVAHCVGYDVSRGFPRFTVRAGSSYRKRGGVVRQATKILPHENPPESTGIMSMFGPHYPPHDIALIKVDKPWPLNGVTISPARLPRQDDPIPVGSPATIMGWGATEHGTASEKLLKQEVVVISHVFCWVSYLWTLDVTDNEICTLFRLGEKPSGTRRGDSGSPVVANGEVVGIASWINEFFHSPDVHTRVSSYIDWIEENVGPLPSAE